MKKLMIVFLFINLYIFSSINVRVGAYQFPPYLNFSKTNSSGKTLELIDALNKIQKKYNFQLVVTSPSRRYIDFGNKFDLMFYEDLSWGWNEINLETSDISLKDEEVFISTTNYYKDTNFIKDIKTKKILLIKGFHYSFAAYNASEDYLNKNFNVVFSTSPQNTLDFLFNGRAQIAIITKSFLTDYLIKNPSKKTSILINDTPDQIYNLTMLISQNSPISKEEFDNLLKKLKTSEKYKHLL